MRNELKTVDIKGKPYVEVHERIRYFRQTYPEGRIATEILSNDNGRCIIKAIVAIADKVVATGHAYEDESQSSINATSYIENCETSAIGRALGIFGIGIDSSVASADEVNVAITKQLSKPPVGSQKAEAIDDDWIIPVGKTSKGKRAADVSLDNLEGLLGWFKDKFDPNDKWAKRNQARINGLETYIEDRKTRQDNPEDEEEDVPF